MKTSCKLILQEADDLLPDPASRRLRRLKELQALPDNQLYNCYDNSVAGRHKMDVPFKCGCRQWIGGGLVKIEFHSRDERYGSTYQVSDYADIRTLEPVLGEWYFDDLPGV